MSESEDPIYRIICRKDQDYCLASRGGTVVFALINPLDRYQHWTKDETHGATKKDSEGQPAFALVNRATGQAISHCPTSKPVPLVQYNADSCDSVLWTMSKDSKHVAEGFRYIRRVDKICVCWVARSHKIYDGHLMDLYTPNDNHKNELEIFHWKIVKVIPSIRISLFRPSQKTVKINCRSKKGYNLAIDKDGSTVLLVPSNPKDKYQHWIKEMASDVPVTDAEGQKAFALVNKATGKAIKLGFGSNYLVQVAPFNENYMDSSVLWTEGYPVSDSSSQIRLQSNIYSAFNIDEEITPVKIRLQSNIYSAFNIDEGITPVKIRLQSNIYSAFNIHEGITPVKIRLQSNIYLAFNIDEGHLENAPLLLGLSEVTEDSTYQQWKIEDFQ